jgi:hypothetical protein
VQDLRVFVLVRCIRATTRLAVAIVFAVARNGNKILTLMIIFYFEASKSGCAVLAML